MDCDHDGHCDGRQVLLGGRLVRVVYCEACESVVEDLQVDAPYRPAPDLRAAAA